MELSILSLLRSIISASLLFFFLYFFWPNYVPIFNAYAYSEQSLQQVDLHVSKLAPGMVLKKITIPYSNDQKQTGKEL